MNKKLFLGMFAAAGMLLATSCSNDELDMVQSGNEAQVTFSLGLEGGIATRAISDGQSAKKLICAVYDANNEVIKTISINNQAVNATTGQFVNDKAFQSGLTDQINVTLAKGQTYTMVFWAQNGACDAYETDDLKAVEVDYTNGTDENGDFNNDDTRDAFYAAETFKVEGNKEINVTLKRPFAQINVGVTSEDWDAAVASNITIDKSSVVIKNAATSINLLTGEVGDETTDVEVSYIASKIPQNEMLKVDTDGDGKDEEYHWLSMSYILVADHDGTEDENGLLGTDKATLQGLQYTFTPISGSPIAFEEGLAGAPVRRNWRTNILGKILTGDVQFNITIDPAYNGDYIYPDGSEIEQELQFASTFGGTVTLTKNVTLTEPLNVTADMILNMGTYKLTGSINVEKDASLTVNGGTIENTDENTSGIVSNGDLTLNNVDIISARHALRIESGNVVIDGGTYKVNPTSAMTLHALNVGDDNTVANVTINGGTFIGPKGTNADSGAAVAVKAGSTVTIEGGDFSGGKTNTLSSKGTLTISGGKFDQNPSTWVTEGYKTIEKDGLYYVVADGVDAVATDSEDLNALEKGNNVVITDDMTISANETTANSGYGATGIEINNGATFDGNGNTLSVTDANSNWDCAVTLKNGTLKNATINDAFRGVFMGSASGDVYIDNVVLDYVCYTFNSDGGKKEYGVYISNTTLNGWTSFSNVHKEVVFTNCKFGKGSGVYNYAFCRPYAPCVFENCEFSTDMEFDTSKQNSIAFKNCTYGGVKITSENAASLKTGDVTFFYNGVGSVTFE